MEDQTSSSTSEAQVLETTAAISSISSTTGSSSSSEAQVQETTAAEVGTSSSTTVTGSTKISPSVEIRTITHVFRAVLVQYVDPINITAHLRFQLGDKYSRIFDTSKKSRRDGMEELLLAIEQMTDKRGIAKSFMDSLRRSGHKFVHDVIMGKEKLEENWDLKNLLLGTEQDLMKVPPLELLPYLTCFENPEREAVRSSANHHGPTIAMGELLLRLGAKPPRTFLELIDGLRKIEYRGLAQSLEDAFVDRREGADSRGDPDGHHDDDDDDAGGPSKGPHDKNKPSDGSRPDDDKPESGGQPNTGGAADGDGMPRDDGRSGDQVRSGDDGESDGGNISQMLQFLKLSDTSKTASSSASSASESKNTGRCDGASCSSAMTIESLKLYDYQEELAEHSLSGKNSVIVAPTGSGKTRVAVAIAIKALKEQKGKVVFVVNKVALVEQQKNAFQEFIPEVVGISGDMSSQVPLVHQLEQADVIVLTAQILLNELQDRSFSFSKLSLIILDECHNTQKENSYNTIMAHYRDEKKRNLAALPQVVGLTASLGVRKAKKQIDAVKHVLKLCANLDAQQISRVVKYEESLKKSYHRPKEETIGVRGRDDSDPFKIKLGLVMDRIEQCIFSTADGKKILERQREMKEMSSHRGTQQYEGEVTKLLEYIPINVKNSETARVLQDCALFLKMYNQSLYINRDARTVDALNHITSYIQELVDRNQNTQDSVRMLIALFGEIKPEIEEICRGPSNQNPVLQRLEEILVQEYNGKPETLAILFTNTRDSTRALQAWIQESPALNLLNPGTLIGTGGSTGMTQTQQEQLLAMFKEKKHKLVISTSVAEEGLDIQMCNLVIRYNYVRDDIGRVQARGRSRAEGGKFYLVFNSRLPKLAERERMNKIRERMMQEATETVCNMIKNNKEEYQEQIAEFQRVDASERSLQESGRRAAEKKKSGQKVHSDVRLLCKHCRQFICYTDDIRCINKQHHIVVDEEFQDRIITERLMEEKNLYGEVTVSKEIQCKRCKKQLGFMMIFREHELPLLSIRYLVIELPKGIKVHKKKWSETTSIFTIKDIDLEDLAERLKFKEEDAKSDDAAEEKEQ